MTSIVKKLTGGDVAEKAAKNAAIGKGFTGGGFKVTPGKRNISVGRTDERQNLLDNISSLYGGLSGEYENLLTQVKPGIGMLTESAVSTLENKKRSAIGNLRENLNRRRVMGSSFAADAETRSSLEYDQAIKEAKAQSYLQELDLTTQLIDKKYNANLSAFNVALQNLNLEAEIGTNLAISGQAALTSIAQMQMQMASAGAEGLGSLAGMLLSPTITQAGGKLSGAIFS